MSRDIKSQFIPDYTVPPGETLLETLETIGMSQAELAERTGRPKKTINEIIKGKAAITPETALQLERALGIPANFWNNLERNYQETLARINEQKKLEKNISWLDKFPVSALIRMGWIKRYREKTQQLKEILNFFGVASPEQWSKKWLGDQVSYRKSKVFQSDPYATATWLRMGEIHAHQIECKPYDSSKFKTALNEIRKLTNQPPEDFFPKVISLCAEAGVAVAFTSELPKIRTWGATKWMNPNKAVIQLSLRYKSDDHLWFSFFHEAGHILLHGKKAVFIENDSKDLIQETEADKFAANFLIPPEKYRKLKQRGQYNHAYIQDFASELGISPGIVVGRLQHDHIIPHNICNELKKRFVWKPLKQSDLQDRKSQ
ncbi:MAG: Antitoxin HigA [candidate division WS2 bacterium]|uniref:Antitoxin HigA n=1 Tax=Psychracetigena formicireducens TaxID=2986056 RepID=A0A9E2BHT6_PSYF1|nr:Antitoxin HigA [Candidatus Psychracetigena formicireducens]